MFNIFQRSPIKQLENHHDMLLSHAFQAQRKGDIRQYSVLTAEAESVREWIQVIKDQQAQ